MKFSQIYGSFALLGGLATTANGLISPGNGYIELRSSKARLVADNLGNIGCIQGDINTLADKNMVLNTGVSKFSSGEGGFYNIAVRDCLENGGKVPEENK